MALMNPFLESTCEERGRKLKNRKERKIVLLNTVFITSKLS